MVNFPAVRPAESWMKDVVLQTRQSLLAEAELLDVEPHDLAATMLCAILAEDWSAFAQVGDGAIVTPEVGTQSWSWLFWPQRGEYANSTVFLTDRIAVDRLEVGVLSTPQQEVALFTDGLQHLVLHYEEQTVHSSFFERMMSPIRSSGQDGEDLKLCSDLERYLGSPVVRSRSDDDLTLVLATKI
jgi:Protein phosphatase 2C